MYVNPIEILGLSNATDTTSIDNEIVKKAKRKLFADIDLSDNGVFPIDAWIMASGFVHIDAITNGVYMKALNNRESIAMVLIDLADNYNAKFPNNDGAFVLKCCEIAIKEYPNFVTALILKAETQLRQIEKEQNKEKHDLLFKELETQYKHIHKLGYRNMPEDMYLNWLVSLKSERNKYENKKMNTFNKK